MQKQQISKFFEDAGFNYKDMEINKFYPISGWEILTHSSSGNVWKKVTHLVRKDSCTPVIVKFLNTRLAVSPEHQFWVQCGGVESWVEAVDLVEESSDINLLYEDGSWVTAKFEAGCDEIDILDMTVEDAESYYSNGVLSHNTMYGDPMTVPGGNAIPYHASVRIKLGAGSMIENSKKEPIGINVSAKIVKNKVAPPFRTCGFQIHFGRGIIEHEEIFDSLRDHGEETIDGHKVFVGGDGAWKKMLVTAPDGKVLIDRKFYKADFADLLKDKELIPWLDKLLDAVYIRTAIESIDQVDIDTDSYEEVRSLSEELNTPDLELLSV